jgi:hypothetical protein
MATVLCRLFAFVAMDKRLVDLHLLRMTSKVPRYIRTSCTVQVAGSRTLDMIVEVDDVVVAENAHKIEIPTFQKLVVAVPWDNMTMVVVH